ncbi:hypothetical protein [Ectobacillus ponti]|uniref:Uncharacterized protein n=1 Tax=Ectobacillus ponti TaxID=2961894 RepID=A0AA41X7W5_9BACI|nr:hypothetical protein [Ectobacillus ponti]MCP8970551.1 hypothetical protein [Ectobacillus ponti]
MDQLQQAVEAAIKAVKTLTYDEGVVIGGAMAKLQNRVKLLEARVVAARQREKRRKKEVKHLQAAIARHKGNNALPALRTLQLEGLDCFAEAGELKEAGNLNEAQYLQGKAYGLLRAVDELRKTLEGD